MSTTLQHPKTVDLITIPAPKFAIGQKVKTEHDPELEILGWMYAPINPDPESSEFPVWEPGFAYFVVGPHYCPTLQKTFILSSTVPESWLKPIDAFQ